MSNLSNRLATLGGVPVNLPVILWAGTIYTLRGASAWYSYGKGIIGLSPIIVAPNTNNTVLQMTIHKSLCDYYTVLSMHATLQRDSYNDLMDNAPDMSEYEFSYSLISVPQLKYEDGYIYYKQWVKSSSSNQLWDGDEHLADSSRRLEISLTVVGYAS